MHGFYLVLMCSLALYTYAAPPTAHTFKSDMKKDEAGVGKMSSLNSGVDPRQCSRRIRSFVLQTCGSMDCDNKDIVSLGCQNQLTEKDVEKECCPRKNV